MENSELKRQGPTQEWGRDQCPEFPPSQRTSKLLTVNVSSFYFPSPYPPPKKAEFFFLLIQKFEKKVQGLIPIWNPKEFDDCCFCFSYIGTMPRYVRVKTWLFGIILCSLLNLICLSCVFGPFSPKRCIIIFTQNVVIGNAVLLMGWNLIPDRSW